MKGTFNILLDDLFIIKQSFQILIGAGFIGISTTCQLKTTEESAQMALQAWTDVGGERLVLATQGHDWFIENPHKDRMH